MTVQDLKDGGINIKNKNMKYILPILAGIIIGLAINSFYVQSSKIDKANLEIAKLKLEADSLQNELFITKTILGRYELTLEHLKEIDKKSYKTLEDFMSKEVE